MKFLSNSTQNLPPRTRQTKEFLLYFFSVGRPASAGSSLLTIVIPPEAALEMSAGLSSQSVKGANHVLGKNTRHTPNFSIANVERWEDG